MPEGPPFPWPSVMDQAWRSYAGGGWGIGAVAVGVAGVVLAEGMNCAPPGAPGGPVSLRHAEMVVLESTDRALLRGCQVFSSVEPCVMCLGALTFCRVPLFHFAARDLSFSPAARHLRSAPVLGRRVPDGRGPSLDAFGVFARLLSMVAETEHALARARFGLERRLCPRLVETTERHVARRTFRQAAERGQQWSALFERLSPQLTACVPEAVRAEQRLRRLGLG